MNHLTGMILPPPYLSQVREEHFAWRGIASAKMCDHFRASKAPGLPWVKSALRGRPGACPDNRFSPSKLIQISPELLWMFGDSIRGLAIVWLDP